MVSLEEKKLSATPAIGIALILLGVLLTLNLMSLEVLLGVGSIVIGVLIVLGEFT